MLQTVLKYKKKHKVETYLKRGTVFKTVHSEGSQLIIKSSSIFNFFSSDSGKLY